MSRPLALRWEGKPIEARLELRPPHAAIERDGRRLEAEFHLEKHGVEVRSPNGAARCAVSVGARQVWITHRGVTWVLERVQREAARDEGAAGEDEIRAPMTGRVVRVAATAGAPVQEGDLILTIEAMKMEFKLTAPETGTLLEIRCAEGDRVELGQLLAKVVPAASGTEVAP